MKLEQITYSDRYRSRSLEITAKLTSQCTDIESCLAELMELVQRKLREPEYQESIELENKLRELSVRKRWLEAEIKNLESTLEAAVEAERLAGLKKEEPDPDDIPFEVGNIPESESF